MTARASNSGRLMTFRQAATLRRSAVQCFLGTIALALVTLACFRLEAGLATTAFVYLIVIVLLSLRGSFFVSAILSIVAVVALNYFLPRRSSISGSTTRWMSCWWSHSC
jgi:K+-sensing histidine kinase KdpD